MNKRQYRVITILLLMMLCCLSACGSSIGTGEEQEPLSDYVPGEWSGQVDVADIMYQELGDELGIELSPEPEYCGVTVSFREDQTFVYQVDIDEFAAAAGKCAEPYVSAIMGFSTDTLVDLIMQYVAKDIAPETGMEEGTYTVDEEQRTVTISDGNGGENVLQLMKDGSLQYEDTEIDQVITLKKN